MAKPLPGTLPVITAAGKVNYGLDPRASAKKHPVLTITHISVAKPDVKGVKNGNLPREQQQIWVKKTNSSKLCGHCPPLLKAEEKSACISL